MTEKFFKITNSTENHKGFQYVNGLNILDKEFQKEGAGVPGGLYFSDVTNIFKYANYGIYLREIILPTEDPDFQMVQDPSGDKWRANRIILGERRNLFDVSTLEYLISLGADIGVGNDKLIVTAASRGHLEAVKFLVEKGADITTQLYSPVQEAGWNGHSEIVKFLIKYDKTRSHLRIPEDNQKIVQVKNEIFRFASSRGHSEIVKFLIEEGADYRSINDYAIIAASEFGHLEIVKILIENGVDCKACSCAVKFASENGHLEIVKLLVENDADVTTNNNYAIKHASMNGHLEIVQFLTEKGAQNS